VPTPATGGGTGIDEVTIQSSYPSLEGLELWVDPNATAGSSTGNHSTLNGLANDDHLQYHNDARGDGRYIKKTGDAMAGPLVVQIPTLQNQAARLQDADAWKFRKVVGGNGLTQTGDGSLAQDVTLAVGKGDGIVVAADQVSVDTNYLDVRYVTQAKFVVSTADPSGVYPQGSVWVKY